MTVTAVVQARMGSHRYPGKVMQPLVGGLPLIEVLLDRLSASKRITKIVVATSTREIDDRLEDHVRRLGFHVFRGSEHDVLSRFYLAAVARASKSGLVVRVTGDCPLIDSSVVDRVIDSCQQQGVDYASNIDPPTFPDGLDTEVFSWRTLEEAFLKATSAFDREHVTPFMREPGRFRTANVVSETDYSGERWTVDEPVDLKKLSAVFEHFWPRTRFDWTEALRWFGDNPSLSSLNNSIVRNAGAKVDNNGSISMRPAKLSDARLVHNLRNEVGMRSASFHSQPIEFKHHIEWFERVLKSERSLIFVAESLECVPIGFIRFDKGLGQAEISVTVDSRFRGRGFGTKVIEKGVEEFLKLNLQLTPVAIIKKENIASIKSFAKAGFEIVKFVDVESADSVEMRLLGV